MNILVINPNTTEDFTQKVHDVTSQYESTDVKIITTQPEYGPKSIECIYDEILSSVGTIQYVIENEDKFDGIVVACFSDHPSVYALREVTSKPVVGIAEASMLMACLVGRKFSVVTTNKEWEPLLYDAAIKFGLEARIASVRTTGMSVLELETEKPDVVYQKIRENAEKAISEDGAEVICLGCAGMAGLDKKLATDIHVPVIDGVAAGLLFIEDCVRYGITTSKVGAYGRPGYKGIIGMADSFSMVYKK